MTDLIYSDRESIRYTKNVWFITYTIKYNLNHVVVFSN